MKFRLGLGLESLTKHFNQNFSRYKLRPFNESQVMVSGSLHQIKKKDTIEKLIIKKYI